MASVYADLLSPLAERFQPQLLLVSAGYDAHWDDPLAGLRLSLPGYWQMAQHVMRLGQALCSGRVVVVLEGGYNLKVLAHGVADISRALIRLLPEKFVNYDRIAGVDLNRELGLMMGFTRLRCMDQIRDELIRREKHILHITPVR